MPPKAAAKEEQQVQYQDAEGRKCLIKKNSAGNLDFFISNKLKVKQLEEVCIGIDHTVYFDGQRIAFPDASSRVSEKNGSERDRVIQEIMALATSSGVMTRKSRCFVKVISGKGLRAADIGGKSDPYVICKVPNKTKSQDKTNFKSRTLSPQWHEILEIEGWESGDELHVECWDHDYSSADDFLGYGKINADSIDRARSGTPLEQEVSLGDDGKHGAAGKEAKGSIKVQVFIGGGQEARPEDARPAEPQESPHDKARREMVDEVFRALSTSELEQERFPTAPPAAVGEEKIWYLQVRRLAQLLGFHCEPEVWKTEFDQVSQENRWGEVDFWNRQQFHQVLDRRLCSDGQLEKVCQELRNVEKDPARRLHVVADRDAAWQPREATQAELRRKPRRQLIGEIFRDLDTDAKKGHLSHIEMNRYAQLCGFNGSDDEWTMEWAELCLHEGIDAKEGIDEEAFAKLVDSQGGSFFSDDAELRMCSGGLRGLANTEIIRSHKWELREKTIALRSERPREELVRVLFDTLDENRSGGLQQLELRKLAELCGWEGEDEEWAVQFGEICQEYNVNLVTGATFDQFGRLLDKKAGLEHADGQGMVDMIDKASHTGRQRPGLSKQRTWQDMSPNYSLLREVCVWLRAKFQTCEQAWRHFAEGRPRARLSKEMFLNILRQLEHEDEERAKTAWRLITLGSTHIVQKNFKWIWGFVEAEEHARRMQRRETRDKERLQEVLEGSMQEKEGEEDAGTKIVLPTEAREAEPRARRRHEITNAIFKQFAADGGDPNGDRVAKEEVRKLGQLLGFHCNPEGWEEEFDEICTELQCQNTGSLDQDQFSRLLDEDLCTDKQVNDVHHELRNVKTDPQRKLHIVASVWVPRERTKALLQLQPHAELVGEVFRALDTDTKQGFLSHVEMKTYAELCGFFGSDDEWKMEWSELCHENGVDAKEGIDEAKFGSMISQDCFYSDDDELRMCLGALQPPGLANTLITRNHSWVLRDETLELRSSRPKEELVKILFDTLDQNESGRLQQDELRELARLCGWEGTTEEWAMEYGDLCHTFNIEPKSGATYQQFKNMLDQKAGLQDADSREVAALVSKKISKQRTWTEASQNYLMLRDFSLFLRRLFGDSVEKAWSHFVGNIPLARLSREEFMQKLKALNFDGKATETWKLIALGTDALVLKHFKFVYGLLAAEEYVRKLERMNTREKQSLEESARLLEEDPQFPADKDASRPGVSQHSVGLARQKSQGSFSDASTCSSLSQAGDQQPQVAY